MKIRIHFFGAIISIIFAIFTIAKLDYLVNLHFGEVNAIEKWAAGISYGGAGSSFILIQLIAIIVDIRISIKLWRGEGRETREYIWIAVGISGFVGFVEPFIALALGDVFGWLSNQALDMVGIASGPVLFFASLWYYIVIFLLSFFVR